MRIGIVGAGAIARRGHLPIYGTIPEVEVVGIADIDQSLAASVAQEFNIPRYSSTCEELLQDTSIQLVDICTPPHTHLKVVKTAAEAGKHVLVEKPLTTSLKDALGIQRLVNDSGIKLCVVQNYRFFPAAIAARKRISQGYLGEIVTIHGVGLVPFPTHWTLGTWPYQHGGALYDFGPHLLDMVLWMKDFSPIRRIYASGGDFTQGNMDFVNYSVINIEFENGSIATANISWVTGTMMKFALDVYGTGGNLFLDVRNDVLSETHGFATPLDDARLFIKKSWGIGKGVLTGKYFQGANRFYRPLIHNYIQAIEHGRPVPVPVDEAVICIAILEAAQESIRQATAISFRDWFEERSR
jgi:predicted dehydrogenase